MPAISVSTASSTHDGLATWNSRSSASGTNFTGTLVSPIIGPHFDTSLVYAAFFVFTLNYIPQGSVINSTKLELRTNNAYTGGLTNHIYVAVENNLDPLGTGAIVNGTLGSQPWQRLGRQSAATTLFGNRCGPTHNKAGQSLSTYGAHVRDTSALVYKAFCTDQANTNALGRDLAGGSWVQTENFTPALQKLVDDPSWNSTSQSVMVWLFADINGGGTTFNVGYLGGFAWDNGTVGAASYGNGGGQNYYYDQSSGLYAPKLNVDYTVTSLAAKSSGSSSTGNVRLRPAIPLGRMRGERAELINYNGIVPRLSSGAHDLPLTGMSTFNPLDPAWAATSGNPTTTRTKWSTQRPGRVDGNCVLIEDYANHGPYIWWDIDAYQSDYASRDVYSLRFYHRYDRDAVINVNPPLCIFRLNGVESFRIEHKQYVVGSPDTAMNLRLSWSGGSTAWTSNEFRSPGSYGFYRYEIQVDAAQNPKVRVRVYLNDATTALATFSGNPTTVEMDEVRFQDAETTAFFLFHQRIADFEMWTDYLLNREYPDDINNVVGTPYTPPPWQWFEHDGSSQKELEDLGTITSINLNGTSPVLDSAGALTLEDHTPYVADEGVTPYTLYPALSYGVGNARKLDLYVPTGTPPAGGWPVIMYTHGGFWVSGSRDSISNGLVRDATLRGYAVASCSYVLSGVYFSSLGQSYPAYDANAASGRYPTHILNYKEAAYWLQSNAATYGLNPAKFVATGHSAGGYNSLGAALSRGVTNDGAGRNLTLAGNAAFGCPNVPDPAFIGTYSWTGPVSLNALKSWDPSHPNYPYGGTGVGTIHVTARLFRGELADIGTGNVDFCGIDDIIAVNAANLPPIGYAWSPYDYLVINAPFTPYSQNVILENKLNAVAGSLPVGFTYTSHEVPDGLHHTVNDADLDYQSFFSWLDDIVNT